MSPYEQETIINFNREEKCAYVYTADPVMMRKLDRLCKEFPKTYILKAVMHDADGVVTGKDYVVNNKKLIAIRRERPKRNLTEEQRKAYSERAKKMQEAKVNKNKEV